MQSESCIWYMERDCNFVLSQEYQTIEAERRERSFLFFSYFIILQDTSVVVNTVSSSRLRTASVTMVS